MIWICGQLMGLLAVARFQRAGLVVGDLMELLSGKSKSLCQIGWCWRRADCHFRDRLLFGSASLV